MLSLILQDPYLLLLLLQDLYLLLLLLRDPYLLPALLKSLSSLAVVCFVCSKFIAYLIAVQPVLRHLWSLQRAFGHWIQFGSPVPGSE